jgi:hypothetical protein
MRSSTETLSPTLHLYHQDKAGEYPTVSDSDEGGLWKHSHFCWCRATPYGWGGTLAVPNRWQPLAGVRPEDVGTLKRTPDYHNLAAKRPLGEEEAR